MERGWELIVRSVQRGIYLCILSSEKRKKEGRGRKILENKKKVFFNRPFRNYISHVHIVIN